MSEDPMFTCEHPLMVLQFPGLLDFFVCDLLANLSAVLTVLMTGTPYTPCTVRPLTQVHCLFCLLMLLLQVTVGL